MSANPTLPKIADDHPPLRPSLATAPMKGRATRGAALPPSYTTTWDTTSKGQGPRYSQPTAPGHGAKTLYDIADLNRWVQENRSPISPA